MMIWHVLDVKAIWIKEFASALAKNVTVLGWLPEIENLGRLQNYEISGAVDNPPLRVRRCPLQRGFARQPVSWLAGEGARLHRRIAGQTPHAAFSPLICTAPHYAATAARWPGPVVYYVTDMIVAYGERPQRIRALDRRICKAADLVCPNSQRIADYLIAEAGCAAEKIQIIPNATRAANVLPHVARQPFAAPWDMSHLPRPVAGVIGNMAANINWVLLREVVARTPWLSWVFVGPTEMDVPEAQQFAARQHLIEHGGRVLFVGNKPYGELRDYARTLDVAILPYRKKEPTFSGSSTRFYEHLATCRPMVSTRGFEELLHKEPLLRLGDTPEEMVHHIEQLRAVDFSDGYEELRWRASHEGTWETRAATMEEALRRRVRLPDQQTQTAWFGAA